MNAAKAQRGRPKGSGINDQQRLVAIARLVSADPSMKPTTAIKALGITDPSTIRRLRDKFNSCAPELKSGTAGSSAPAVSAPQQASSRRAALKIVDPVKRVQPRPAPVISAVPGLTGQAPARPARSEAVPVVALLFGFGLNAATALFEQQMMIAQSVMKLPQVRDLVRHQIAFTEFMLSVANPSPGPRLAH